METEELVENREVRVRSNRTATGYADGLVDRSNQSCLFRIM